MSKLSTYPTSTVPGAENSSKPRYELLDGLRGVAAVFVIWYHFFEGFATSPTDQMMNHGYLAVDFFFILSGFVLGYAYDERWKQGMTACRFMLRRVIRLHPMVILSVILGAVAFVVQGCEHWDGTPAPLSMVLLALLTGLFLIPVYPGAGADVRGNGEMFPLNGPSWSLFFEYIGSILYALWLHKLSNKWLRVVVAASAAGLAWTALGNQSGSFHLGVGWSMANYGLLGGFCRLSFSFSIGLLLSRTFKARHIRGAFWICSAILAAIFSTPYVVGPSASIYNAWFDLGCTLIVFPFIVYIGACGTTTDTLSTKLCSTLGQLSYPVYIIHYPVMYLFYAWVWANGYSFENVWPVCIAIFFAIIFMAWLAFRFYDAPLRSWLAHRLLKSKK